jgi:hypothetical protein
MSFVMMVTLAGQMGLRRLAPFPPQSLGKNA